MPLSSKKTIAPYSTYYGSLQLKQTQKSQAMRFTRLWDTKVNFMILEFSTLKCNISITINFVRVSRQKFQAFVFQIGYCLPQMVLEFVFIFVESAQDAVRFSVSHQNQKIFIETIFCWLHLTTRFLILFNCPRCMMAQCLFLYSFASDFF